uniref:hypothetical protein n=1 Tax=Simonsiella muelleri TaxID=72 RepID=UPI0023F54A7E
KRNGVEVYGNPKITALKRVALSHDGELVHQVKVKYKKLRAVIFGFPYTSTPLRLNLGVTIST